MTIKIHYKDIDESLQARDSEEALSKFKKEASKRAPFALRLVINSMGDLKFAGEVVSRANKARQTDDPAPKSAKEFLDWAQKSGFVTITE